MTRYMPAVLAIALLTSALVDAGPTPRPTLNKPLNAAPTPRTTPSAASRTLIRPPLAAPSAEFLSELAAAQSSPSATFTARNGAAVSPVVVEGLRETQTVDNTSAGNTHPIPTSIPGPADDGPGVSGDAGKRAATPGPTKTQWAKLAFCESRNRWHINTSNGYYGGLQENMAFWTAYDGLDYAARPDLATMTQQITVAERARGGYTNHAGRTWPARGYEPWPQCAKSLGLVGK